MTNLILESEILNNVLEDKSINRQEIMDIYQNSIKNSNDLFLTAQNLRIKNKELLLQGGFDFRVRLFATKSLKQLVNLKFH